MMRSSYNIPAEAKEKKLEIYTLGKFQVYCGGEKLFSETGRSRKTGELFMYFVTHRWQPATPEIILESLWTAIVSGEPVRLEWPAEIENDRTIAPLRFVSENLGARVSWDGLTRTVTIVK